MTCACQGDRVGGSRGCGVCVVLGVVDVVHLALVVCGLWFAGGVGVCMAVSWSLLSLPSSVADVGVASAPLSVDVSDVRACVLVLAGVCVGAGVLIVRFVVVVVGAVRGVCWCVGAGGFVVGVVVSRSLSPLSLPVFDVGAVGAPPPDDVFGVFVRVLALAGACVIAVVPSVHVVVMVVGVLFGVCWRVGARCPVYVDFRPPPPEGDFAVCAASSVLLCVCVVCDVILSMGAACRCCCCSCV